LRNSTGEITSEPLAKFLPVKEIGIPGKRSPAPLKKIFVRGHLKKFWLLFCLTGFLGITAVLFSPVRRGLFPPAYADPPDGAERSSPEKALPEPSGGLGSREIPREDGGKDRVYYSVTTPQEEEKTRQEEKEKEEKSWEMLRNIIIDRRTR